MHRRVKVLSVTGGALAAVLLVASAAFACVSLATLDVTPGKGAPGASVKANGTGFNTGTAYSDVELRWGGLTGTVLFKGRATSGNMSFNFTVPDAAPGTYVVVANQLDPNGAPLWGMPARVTFTVSGAAAGVAPAAEAAPAPEQVIVEQKYQVVGETPAAAAAPAQPAVAPAQVAAAPAKAAPAQAAPAPAAADPAQPLSLEARDAITEQVAPVGARQVNYVPAASRAQSSGSHSLQLGLALAVVGSMALLTAAGAAFILRPARAESR